MIQIITMKSKGDFKTTIKFLKFISSKTYKDKLENYAKIGQAALEEATPVRTGKTKASWSYKIEENSGSIKITWINDNLADGKMPVVMLLVNGHATKSGYWVKPNDFVTPAIEPVFNKIAEDLWKEVVNA